MSAKAKLTTNELIDKLERHVCKDGANGHGFAFLQNVRNGTGYRVREGYADAISMELTPSRGLKLNGYELKVSRNDWLKELKNPQKADFFYQHCDRWFLVVGDKDIVKDGELPDTWGLIAPRGNGLAVVKAAPLNEEVKVVDRLFLASLIRSAIRAAAKPGELRKAREEGYASGKDEQTRRNEYGERELKEAKEAIRKFEQESGVSITAWYQGGKPEEVGAALKVVLAGDKDADRILQRLSGLGRDVDEVLEKYDIEKAAVPALSGVRLVIDDTAMVATLTAGMTADELLGLDHETLLILNCRLRGGVSIHTKDEHTPQPKVCAHPGTAEMGYEAETLKMALVMSLLDGQDRPISAPMTAPSRERHEHVWKAAMQNGTRTTWACTVPGCAATKTTYGGSE